MHFCGDLFHDVPIWILAGLTMAGPVGLWIRSFFYKKKCDCGNTGICRSTSSCERRSVIVDKVTNE